MRVRCFAIASLASLALACVVLFALPGGASPAPVAPVEGDFPCQSRILQLDWEEPITSEPFLDCGHYDPCEDDVCEHWDSDEGETCRCKDTVQPYCCDIHLKDGEPVAYGLCRGVSCQQAGPSCKKKAYYTTVDFIPFKAWKAVCKYVPKG